MSCCDPTHACVLRACRGMDGVMATSVRFVATCIGQQQWTGTNGDQFVCKYWLDQQRRNTHAHTHSTLDVKRAAKALQLGPRLQVIAQQVVNDSILSSSQPYSVFCFTTMFMELRTMIRPPKIARFFMKLIN